MEVNSALYGLVICGGNSSRMGMDKGRLNYHGNEQRYHLYEMLSSICSKVIIACNAEQVASVDPQYQVLTDDPEFENTGPIAALLTATRNYPEASFLAIGCDYPFLLANYLRGFLSAIQRNRPAAAFYNETQQLYEPLLAWYSADAGKTLMQQFSQGQYSLQSFLKAADAEKYIPADERTMLSVDTPEAYESARRQLIIAKPGLKFVLN